MEITNEDIKKIDSIGFFEFLREKLVITKAHLIHNFSKKEQVDAIKKQLNDDLWVTLIDDILDLDEEREVVNFEHERKEALKDLKRLRALIDFFNQEHAIFGYDKGEMSFLEVKTNFKVIELPDRRCIEDLDENTVYGEYKIRFKIRQGC